VKNKVTIVKKAKAPKKKYDRKKPPKTANKPQGYKSWLQEVRCMFDMEVFDDAA